MKKYLVRFSVLFSFFMLISFGLKAQNYEYEIELEAVEIENLGGLQSFAIGTWDGYSILIGGRLDGLHQRQPFASFDEAGHNTQIFVVDPESKEVWKKSVLTLPTSLREQMSSTNMQFTQSDDELIITGGYGYSASAGDHVTYAFLTRIDLKGLTESIINGNSDDPLDAQYFEQISDPRFAVTGGRLLLMDDMYYLVGGHRFMGRYNPMGPDHGPGFEQDYTYEARRFTIVGVSELAVEFIDPLHDEMHMRRRDFNVVPFFQDGEKGIIAYSGVFQPTSDVPWLYPVKITEEGITADESFTQYFNHYHSASLPIYNQESDVMHTLFFGGIAQFYMDNDVLVQDNDIPFVQTIADVQLSKEGFSEHKLSAEMPDYLGAGSEFVYIDDVPKYSDEVIDGDAMGDDKLAVGYIFGGIRSSKANIFWENNGTQSEASSTIYKVYLTRTQTVATEETPSTYSKLLLYPNPASNVLKMSVNLQQPTAIDVEIRNAEGKLIHQSQIAASETTTGFNFFELQEAEIPYGMYMYTLKFGDETVTRKVVWSE